MRTADEIIQKIPSIEIDFSFSEFSDSHFYCLQTAPNLFAGRLLNDARVEGVIDHFSVFHDDIGGNFNFEGFRYLIRGYFRFGSSGAPYIVYKQEEGKYYANAIQSEASGIQFAAKNDREGNIQYTHAIASPLVLIKDELEQIISRTENAGFTL